MEIRVRIDDDLALALPALEARLGRPVAEWLAEIAEGNLEAEVVGRVMEATDVRAKAKEVDWRKVASEIEEARGGQDEA